MRGRVGSQQLHKKRQKASTMAAGLRRTQVLQYRAEVINPSTGDAKVRGGEWSEDDV